MQCVVAEPRRIDGEQWVLALNMGSTGHYGEQMARVARLMGIFLAMPEEQDPALLSPVPQQTQDPQDQEVQPSSDPQDQEVQPSSDLQDQEVQPSSDPQDQAVQLSAGTYEKLTYYFC